MAAENSTLGPANHAPLSVPMWQLWTGRVLSALPVLLLLLSASMKLSHPPVVIETFVGKLGYPANMLPALAVLELFCAVVYAVPRTAVLGAILLTGYLGGAVATHVRVGDVFVVPLLLGVLVWAGLYLRDDRIRALLPLRKSRAMEGSAGQ
jgi:DoxX-like family